MTHLPQPIHFFCIFFARQLQNTAITLLSRCFHTHRRSRSGHCLGIIYLISGEIHTYILSEEGRDVTLFHLYDGDPCVFSAACAISQLTFETLICTERNCEILVINTGTFSWLTERNIYVHCFMYELITDCFSTDM